MGVIDVDALLRELAPDAPCGPNLEYDPAFVDLEKAAQGKPEVQYGETLVPAEPPDWKDVKRQALELLARSRDLRAAVYLARALAYTDGIGGFSEGLALVEALVRQRWDSVHPQLDPEDDNDPTLRVNTLASLCDGQSTVRSIREAPLVNSRVHGRFSLRDVEIATGEASAPPGEEPPKLATIDAAFLDADPAELQAVADALQRSMAHMQAIEALLVERVGVAQALDFSALTKVLKAARGVVADRLLRRMPEAAPAVAAEAAAPAAGARATATGPRAMDEINSREDVIRVLDKVCEYYSRHEPSSPVPLLVRRAKSLVSKDFLDIIRDLAPDGLSQVEKLQGSSGEGS